METVCQIIGYSCPSWKNFTDGLCGECTNEFPCRHVGFNDHLGVHIPDLSENEKNNPYPLFVILNSRIDFCLMHYQLIVQTETSAMTAKGKLLIRIKSSSNLHTEEIEENFIPGKKYTRLVVRNPDDGVLFDVKVDIFWSPGKGYENVSIDINKIQFRYMSHADER